jgi:CHAT domain-containing protein
VSSYCPTLSSLIERPLLPGQGDFKILTVAQPATPNAAPTPQTEDEVKLVQEIAADHHVINLTREEATVDSVLASMKETNWVHLACHGQQCIGQAMESGLLLQDGKLKLSTIVREHLPRAEFAFLSACQTAMGDESVSEESAHLAAGMLLAGYRGVIATMRSIGDNDGPQIAEDVYRRILEGGKPNWKGAARALHEGVRRLRESGAGFISWVPFIHIGC